VNKFITGNRILPIYLGEHPERLLTPMLPVRSFNGHIGSMSSNDSVSVPRAANTATTLTTQQLFFTTSGRIGTIVNVPSELSLHLTALERNLRRVVTEITHASHAKYRAPVGTWGKSDADAAAYGFLDGDFLEKFLDYRHPSTETERVLQGGSTPEKLKQTYKEIRQSLEALKALH
jgi:DNA damage-binding protein 1